MKHNICAMIVTGIILSCGTADAILNQNATLAEYCYSECASIGCPRVGSCVFATREYPACDSNYNATSATGCVIRTEYPTGKSPVTYYCYIDGESACDFCHSNSVSSNGTFNGYSDWTSIGSNRVQRTKTSWTTNINEYYKCEETQEVEYGCAAGYYTTSTTPSASMTCTTCPPLNGVAATSATGNTSINGCYIPAGSSFSDDSGNGTFIAPCYY